MSNDPFTAVASMISAISLLTNLVLLIVYVRCPLRRISSYKHFFLLIVIEDIAYSVTFTLDIPLVFSQSNVMIFIATGISLQQPFPYILHFTYCMTFFVAFLSITSSFIYRYLQLCRAHLFQRFSTRRTLLIGASINLAIISNIILVIYIAFWPTQDFTNFVASAVHIPEINIHECAFFGFSLKYNMKRFHLALAIELVLLLVVIGSVNVYCAKKIKDFLKNATQSTNFLVLQRQMFVLLLLQAACPVVFLVLGYCAAMFLLFTGIDSNSIITNSIFIMFALFPVFNPIVIIAFVKEYKNFILVFLKLKKPQEHMVVFKGGTRLADGHRSSSAFT